jgi:hypothetical protein
VGALTDGVCIGRRGIYAGMRLALGHCRALGHCGITVVAVSHRVQCVDPVFFEMMGSISAGRARSWSNRAAISAAASTNFQSRSDRRGRPPGLTSPMLNRFTRSRLPRPVIPLEEGVE